jgi:hypothetical protein
MDMEMMAVTASMNALADLLEGTDPKEQVRVAYHAMIGAGAKAIEAAAQAGSMAGWDTVIGIFDPDDVEGGARRIGVAIDVEHSILLQFGRLWLGPQSRKAVLVPRGRDDRWGHYEFEGSRIVHRCGWPAKDLARGIERAGVRLAELTIQHALAA